MGLMEQVEGVFGMLRVVFTSLPTAIRLLIFSAFGGVIFISVLRGIGR